MVVCEMPTQNIQHETMVQEIKVKTVYSGEVMIHYIEDGITYEDLCKEIRGICRFSPDFKVIFGNFVFLRFLFRYQTIFFSSLGLHYKMGG